MQRGKIYLSVGEEAIVEALMETFSITEIDAINRVVGQKRELALIHSLRGNVELAKQIMSEIGED